MRVNKSPNRLIFLLIVVFIATIFLFSKLGRRAPRLETEWLQISYENISCKSFFDEWKAEIPALVIDSDFLNNLNQPNCGRKENTPTKIGIDAKYKSFELTVDRNFFEVIFYKNNASKDYLDFDVDGRRIIPKRFITRRIGNLEVPTEIGKFVEFWKRSKFIDCVGLKIQRDESEPVDMPGQSSSDVLARLRDELIDNKMFPFLSSGTFLGWFRECSTIPHTSDMDLAVYYDNYNPKYLEKLINGETKFRIVRKLGMPADSMEMTLVPKREWEPRIDVFIMYDGIENGTITHSYISGLDDGSVFENFSD
ncbi:unnamed protein product [Caenorhabditis brenneri]